MTRFSQWMDSLPLMLVYYLGLRNTGNTKWCVIISLFNTTGAFHILRVFGCWVYKSLLNLLQYCFCFMIRFFGHEASGNLSSLWGTELPPSLLESEVLITGPPGKSLRLFQWTLEVVVCFKRTQLSGFKKNQINISVRLLFFLILSISLLYILDSTYKWYHTVSLCLTFHLA